MSPTSTQLQMLFSEEDLKKKLEQLQTDKAKNEKEYAEWQASCEAWKKSHANHPNKELFNKYNEEVLIFIDKVIRVSKRYKKVLRNNVDYFDGSQLKNPEISGALYTLRIQY